LIVNRPAGLITVAMAPSSPSDSLPVWSDRPGEFRELVANCMRADYSWARPGQDYLDIYEYIRHK
jgi:glycogen synthase